MKLFSQILILLLFAVQNTAQSNITDTYINRYSEIAMFEMNRTGIPASITLAQGLLESNWGRSELAVKSNNHFGIKCYGGWEGDSHYRHDDEYNKFGKKKKSCFRAYESAEDSFYDHSEFLTDTKKKKRYGFLFELSSDDYKSWAKGLSKSGYATDPKYARKLIKIIEQHELDRFDQQGVDFIVSVPAAPPENTRTDSKKTDQVLTGNNYIKSIKRKAFNNYRITYLNSCKIVVAQGGESIKDLAKKLGVSSRKVLKYNEQFNKKSDKLASGQYLYLECKMVKTLKR